jgi:hypothetical protein
MGAVLSGKIEERKLIGYLESVLRTIGTPEGQSVLKRLGIQGIRLFEDLKSDGLPKVEACIEKRLNG